MRNIVFIGTSLDGYIADKDGGLEFLQSVPNPENDQLGFPEFMDSIDTLLMGEEPMKLFLDLGGLAVFQTSICPGKHSKTKAHLGINIDHLKCIQCKWHGH